MPHYTLKVRKTHRLIESLLSLLCWPKVILLSGVHCTSVPTIYRDSQRKIPGTSQLKWSQNIFPKILVIFKIENLATRNCVKDWGKLSPPPAGLG